MKKKDREMFLKMGVLLIPSAVLICASNVWCVLGAIVWGAVSVCIAKAWRPKWASKMADNEMIKTWLDE